MAPRPQLFQSVRDAARLNAPDLYLSALLAPRAARDDLVTLAAYAGEIARVPLSVSDPMLAEIRLAWWREAIEKAKPGERTGNPVADALLALVEARKLAADDVLAPLHAHEHFVSRGALAAGAELDAYIDATATTLFRMGSTLIAPADADDALVFQAGAAWGRVRLALDLPHHVGLGRTIGGEGLAQEGQLAKEARAHLAEARARFRAASRGLRAAVLPLALVEPYLRALERTDQGPQRQVADIAPVSRAWRLWLASAAGRV